MNKHTPGKWVIDHSDNLIHSRGERNTLICNLSGNVNNPDVLADARLISSAPDLLEALQSIVRSAELNQAAVNTFLLIDARAAIAKALGEQP